MAPSSSGTLNIYAGRNISATAASGSYVLYMSDYDPEAVYGMQDEDVMDYLSNPELHASTPVHENEDEEESNRAVIKAGNNIADITLAIPMAATLWADNDISNISYFGQNLSATDETLIYAGNDIYFETLKDKETEDGITVSGPGLVWMQAGNNIDLALPRESSSPETAPILPWHPGSTTWWQLQEYRWPGTTKTRRYGPCHI